MKTVFVRKNILVIPWIILILPIVLATAVGLRPIHADDDTQFVPDQVIVKLNTASGVTIEEINIIYETIVLEVFLSSAGIYLLQLPSGENVESVVGTMQDDPRLLYAEPNFTGEMPESDPSGTWAWGGHDPAPYLEQYANSMLHLADAHAVTQGDGVIVAVLDTGIQTDHPRLVQHLTAVSYDFVDDDSIPEDNTNGLDDDHDNVVDEGAGHGTHVAGIVNLVAPQTQIMPLRVLDSDGQGNVFVIAEAMQFAANNGADVINLSLGTAAESELLEEVIADLVAEGVVVVAAAGNLNTSTEQYPAAEDAVLAVTAVDPTTVKSPFANYGTWVDIAMPGRSITSTFPVNGYAQWSGTSMATPFAAGQAALIQSTYPTLTSSEIFWLMQSTAQPIDAANPGYEGMLGAGLANVGESLTQASTPDCSQTVTLPAAADAWIEQNSASNNNGTDSILKVKSQGSNDNFRALIRFASPLDMPANCTIASATLRLYAASWTNGRILQALPVTAGWSENSVTWSNQPAAAGTAAETSSGEGYREWDVTVQVQEMLAMGSSPGFLIRDAVENSSGAEQQFHSQEKGEFLPQLVLQFGSAVPPPDVSPPDTAIQTAPAEITTSANAAFTFSANQPAVTFICSLDGSAFAPCSTPASFTNLPEGSHVFAVQAVDSAQNIDPSPAAFAWMVKSAVPAQVSCGQVLMQSTRVLNDLTDCPGDGLVIGAHGITLDLNGRIIDGTGLGSGIRNDGFVGTTLINGTVQEFDYGVALNSGTGNIVAALTLHLNQEAGVLLANAGLNGSSNHIRNNVMTGNGAGLLLVAGTQHTQVENNIITGAGDTAVFLEGASNNTLSGNTITDSSDTALVLTAGSNNNQIANNTITGSSDSGISINESNGNNLHFNTVRDVSDSAITLDNAHNGTVRGNDLRYNAGGIELFAATGNLIIGNDASYTTGSGIALENGSLDNTITLNIASFNGGEGIVVDAEILPENTDPGNRLERNTANGNQGGGISVTAAGHTLTANLANGNDGWGIYAAAGSTNSSGNFASGNSEPQQCFNISCAGGFPPPPPPEDEPPDTIINNGPADLASSSTAVFNFSGSDDLTPLADLAFECRLDDRDDAEFAVCSSPQSYSGLEVGTYTFAVRSVDAAGNVDPTPASYTWTISPPPDCGSQMTVSANADAWIEQNSPSNNKGDDATLKVKAQGGNDNFRTLLRFALPDIPAGCVVESATLRLYASSWKSGRTLQALRLNNSWSEYGVTWNNQPATVGAAATTSSGSGYRQWNVAAQVQAMYDENGSYGFLIRDAVESGSGREQSFHSREKGEYPPLLVITFVPEND